MKINVYVFEFVTGMVFGFEFVDEELKWALHLGFCRIMKLSQEIEDEQLHKSD